MFEALRTRRVPRGIFAVLLVLVLALRILVPTGFMPTKTADGIVVTICDGLGESRSMVIDLGRSGDAGHSGHDEAAGHQPCVFAAAALPMLAGTSEAMVAKPAQLLREFALPPPAAAIPATPDYLTPPLRGPPALA
ncbi:DUF2946 family protein [Sphingomonas changnyeongensis]|nr:DUF2946 family protein [Sphingomonas changnyeongensis]